MFIVSSLIVFVCFVVSEREFVFALPSHCLLTFEKGFDLIPGSTLYSANVLLMCCQCAANVLLMCC
jgi:hypothetical protein